MIDGRRVLAVVPARGGSKGLPRKNVLDLGGRPLIAWTLTAAQQATHIDRCVVSTDDTEIASVARAHGGEVPFMRPAELAGDHAATMDTVFHVLDRLPGFDFVVLLQPTSPLRSAADIEQTLERMIAAGAPACVSVTEPAKSPYWSYRIDAHGRLVPLTDPAYTRVRRQDLPPAYVLNGAVYAARVDWLREQGSFLHPDTLAYPMPAERSLDIDTALDLRLAELLLADRADVDLA